MQTITPVDTQTRRMLDTALRGLPEPSKPAAGCIDTAAMLIHLAERWPNAPDERECQDLQTLCRQIAVSKKVLRYYPADAPKATQGEMLPAEYWSLLITVLLMHAERRPNDDPLDRGLALKCLNGALQALDIADGFAGKVQPQSSRVPLVACPPVPHFASLRAWAERIAENVCSENAG